MKLELPLYCKTVNYKDQRKNKRNKKKKKKIHLNILFKINSTSTKTQGKFPLKKII